MRKAASKKSGRFRIRFFRRWMIFSPRVMEPNFFVENGVDNLFQGYVDEVRQERQAEFDERLEGTVGA
ncbi:MAG: hypothetical protein AAGG44_15685 [Planctomycetota bacterium]